ncbi:SseB family protein [Streptomyces axinellae]|uniref:SseB protein N-terminal domain-containing protein n=1 Tax=Streptomyces axinellae TaxID=552788 RepID=A0ABP6DE49_9ACTN
MRKVREGAESGEYGEGCTVRLTELVLAEERASQEAEDAGRRFQAFLREFRATAVLVPLDDAGGLWSAELGGIRWIMAFSDEEELSRFLLTRHEGGEREYRRILGSHLLDSVVPAVPGPCGVALDAAGEHGTVLPPVAGIVPDRATAEAYAATGTAYANAGAAYAGERREGRA